MASYGVKVAFGVFVDARSLLYLTIAWSKGLAAAHELCSRLSAKASVRRLGATPQEPRSAAERLPPEIWALIRNALVLQTVEAVECDLVRRTLCLTCQDDPGRNRWVSTLAELVTCGDCMSKASGTDLDLRWRRLRGADGHEQVRVSLLPFALPHLVTSRDSMQRIISFRAPTTPTGNAQSARQVRTRGRDCAAADLSEQRRQFRPGGDLPDCSLAQPGAHSRHDLCQRLG